MAQDLTPDEKRTVFTRLYDLWMEARATGNQDAKRYQKAYRNLGTDPELIEEILTER